MDQPTKDGIRIQGNFMMSKEDYRKWITGEWSDADLIKAYPQAKKTLSK